MSDEPPHKKGRLSHRSDNHKAASDASLEDAGAPSTYNTVQVRRFCDWSDQYFFRTA